MSDFEYSFSFVTNSSNSCSRAALPSMLLRRRSGLYFARISSSDGDIQAVNSGPPTPNTKPLYLQCQLRVPANCRPGSWGGGRFWGTNARVTFPQSLQLVGFFGMLAKFPAQAGRLVSSSCRGRRFELVRCSEECPARSASATGDPTFVINLGKRSTPPPSSHRPTRRAKSVI